MENKCADVLPAMLPDALPARLPSVCPDAHLPGCPDAELCNFFSCSSFRLPSSVFRLPDSLTFRRTICPEDHLPGCPSARPDGLPPSLPVGGGCFPFFDKNHFFIPPSENSRHFSKSFTLPRLHLTNS